MEGGITSGFYGSANNFNSCRIKNIENLDTYHYICSVDIKKMNIRKANFHPLIINQDDEHNISNIYNPKEREIPNLVLCAKLSSSCLVGLLVRPNVYDLESKTKPR